MVNIFADNKIESSRFFLQILSTETSIGERYHYKVQKDDEDTPYFIYFAVIKVLCAKKGFSHVAEKLFDYLYLTGRSADILKEILCLLDESGTLHIDGIINFRLGKYMGDIKAFFDMLLYGEIIRKGFEVLGSKPIRFLEN